MERLDATGTGEAADTDLDINVSGDSLPTDTTLSSRQATEGGDWTAVIPDKQWVAAVVELTKLLRAQQH